jgi:hypothetical protein
MPLKVAWLCAKRSSIEHLKFHRCQETDLEYLVAERVYLAGAAEWSLGHHTLEEDERIRSTSAATMSDARLRNGWLLPRSSVPIPSHGHSRTIVLAWLQAQGSDHAPTRWLARKSI